MAVKLSSLRADLEKERKGTWQQALDVIPDPDVKFLVSSIHLPAYTVARGTAFARLSRAHKNNPPEDKIVAEIGRLFGPFDMIMLEIGAFHPSWGTIHLGPQNALQAFKMLGGGTLFPVHWSTFSLGFHAWDAPGEELLDLAPRYGARILTPRLGEVFEPAHVEAPRPWWRALRESPILSRSVTGATGPADLPESA